MNYNRLTRPNAVIMKYAHPLCLVIQILHISRNRHHTTCHGDRPLCLISIQDR